MPEHGKVRIVNDGVIAEAPAVRREYKKLRPLARLTPDLRGWTLDVLRVLQKLGRQTFTLGDVYERDGELSRLHPGNQNIHPKIRQQLQVLRDLGLLQFIARGNYPLLL